MALQLYRLPQTDATGLLRLGGLQILPFLTHLPFLSVLASCVSPLICRLFLDAKMNQHSCGQNENRHTSNKVVRESNVIPSTHPPQPPRHATHYEDACLLRIVTQSRAHGCVYKSQQADEPHHENIQSDEYLTSLLVSLLDQHIALPLQRDMPLTFTRLTGNVSRTAAEPYDHDNDSLGDAQTRKSSHSSFSIDDIYIARPSNMQLFHGKNEGEEMKRHDTALLSQEQGGFRVVVQSVHLSRHDPSSGRDSSRASVPASLGYDHSLSLRISFYEKLPPTEPVSFQNCDAPTQEADCPLYRLRFYDFPAAVLPLENRMDMYVNNMQATPTAPTYTYPPKATTESSETLDTHHNTCSEAERHAGQVGNEHEELRSTSAGRPNSATTRRMSQREQLEELNAKLTLMTKTADITQCVVVGATRDALESYIRNIDSTDDAENKMKEERKGQTVIHDDDKQKDLDTGNQNTNHTNNQSRWGNSDTKRISQFQKLLLCDVARLVSSREFRKNIEIDDGNPKNTSTANREYHLFVPPPPAGRVTAAGPNGNDITHDFLFNCDMVDYFFKKQPWVPLTSPAAPAQQPVPPEQSHTSIPQTAVERQKRGSKGGRKNKTAQNSTTAVSYIHPSKGQTLQVYTVNDDQNNVDVDFYF